MTTSTYHFTPLAGYENMEATTQMIIGEIIARGLPFEIIDADNNLIVVHHEGKEYTIMEGTISDGNSLIAYWISNDKWMTRQFLHRAGVQQAKAMLLQKGKEKSLEIERIAFPLVVKPADTDHGIAVSTNICTFEELQTAISQAFKHSNRVIVEEFFKGKEYRFLVIGGKVRAIAYREPANVIGDGKQSVQELIDKKNVNRGDDYRHPLLKIRIDDEVKRHLSNQNMQLNSIVPENKKIYLRQNSNLSTGGDSIDLTDEMPDYYKTIAEQAAKAAGLNIAGVDIIINDWQAEPSVENYIVVELNAPAMLSMHNYPYIGKNRNVEKYVLDVILNSK
ncbi:MAG: glutamate ligase [Mangrovibacterium sp.]